MAWTPPGSFFGHDGGPLHLLSRPALAWAHGHMPVCLDALGLFSLGHTLVAGISKHIAFIAVHQGAGLRHIVDVRGGAHNGMDQTGVSVHANVNTKGLLNRPGFRGGRLV
jgi:hypothetical protein